jgi:hypothetical protein
MLLDKRQKEIWEGWNKEEKEVNSYWMTLTKQEGTENCKRKH